MEINNTTSKGIHPITIITIPKKKNSQVAIKVLIDQCCTGKGLISFKLANTLGLSKDESQSRSFITTAIAVMTSCSHASHRTTCFSSISG